MTEELSTPVASVWERIRPELDFVRHPYPRAAIDAARAAREEITPHLLQLLDGWVADPSATFDQDCFLHLHVIGLLAEWRETRAYRPLVALASQDEEIGEALFGDASGEVLDRALASVCDGDEAPLLDLARNADVSIWLRNAAISALVVRAIEGDADLETLRAHIQQLGEDEASRLRAGTGGDGTLLGFIVVALSDLGPRAAMPVIRQWFGDSLIDKSMVHLEDVERDVRLTDEELRANGRRYGKTYITDSGDLFSRWHCFSKAYWDRRAAGLEDDDDDDAGVDDDLAVHLPYVRAEPKIGRNDPCPCGSGKKYKKCHGAA